MKVKNQSYKHMLLLVAQSDWLTPQIESSQNCKYDESSNKLWIKVVRVVQKSTNAPKYALCRSILMVLALDVVRSYMPKFRCSFWMQHLFNITTIPKNDESDGKWFPTSFLDKLGSGKPENDRAVKVATHIAFWLTTRRLVLLYSLKYAYFRRCNLASVSRFQSSMISGESTILLFRCLLMK